MGRLHRRPRPGVLDRAAAWQRPPDPCERMRPAAEDGATSSMADLFEDTAEIEKTQDGGVE